MGLFVEFSKGTTTIGDDVILSIPIEWNPGCPDEDIQHDFVRDQLFGSYPPQNNNTILKFLAKSLIRTNK